MKRVFSAIILFFILFVSACTKQGNPVPSDTTALANETKAPEISVDETKPMLFEGEEVYQNWVYTFLDINGNDIAERISFTYVVKNPDNKNDITARLAIEYDFAASGSAESPVYIERNSSSLISPQHIYASKAEDEVLILINDRYAVSGDEFYVFKMSKDGRLSELNTSGSLQFPQNGLSKSYVFDGSQYSITKNGDALTVALRGKSFSYTPNLGDDSILYDSYSLNINTSELVMSYNEETCTLLLGASGLLKADEQPDYALAVKLLVSLRYVSNNFEIIDITVYD